MFDFGKDLKRILGLNADEDGFDGTALELIGADLLGEQARQQSVAAHRAANAKPFADHLFSAVLWREHARRTGQRQSLSKAASACADARLTAASPEQTARAALEAAQGLMAEAELFGSGEAEARAARLLDEASASAEGAPLLQARIAAAHARMTSARARADGGRRAMLEAAALLDAALHGLETLARSGRLKHDINEALLERAALGFGSGVRDREPRLLDQAGRDLRRLIEEGDEAYSPVTRARALTTCGAGLARLGAMAGNGEVLGQGVEMLEAAAELFPADHSPLDAARINAALGEALLKLRAAGGESDLEDRGLRALRSAERATTGRGLRAAPAVSAAASRGEIEQAARDADLGALASIEARLKRRLSRRDAENDPAGWAADQLSLARLYTVRGDLVGQTEQRGAAAMALCEAEQALREHGDPTLADEAAEGLAALLAA